MHIKRQVVTKKIPITRKGSKYVALSSSHKSDSVPLVIAIRDMLKLAKTAKEVQKMINQKLLKINGKPATDLKQSIKLCNTSEADKSYILTLLPTKRFSFQPSESSDRLCKVINKKSLKKNQTQLNLHDGSNLVSSDAKIKVGDSVTLDSQNKVKSHIALEKGKSVFVFSGKHAGLEGQIQEIENKKLKIKFKDEEAPAEIDQSHVIAK